LIFMYTKRNIKILSIYLGVLTCFLSCSKSGSEENTIQVNALPYNTELKAAEHSFDAEANIYNPGEITNVDDQYLVVSDAEDDAIFKVFSLPELVFLYAWGSQGQGPDEFEFVPLNEINTVNNELMVYDIGSQSLIFYSVQDTTFVNEGASELSYEGQADILNNIVRLNDRLFAADKGAFYDDTNHEFVVLQPGSDEPEFLFGEYPDSEFTGPEQYFSFRKTGVSSEAIGKFAAFYLYHNQFNIFDHEGNLLIHKQVEDEYTPGAGMQSDSFRYRLAKWASDNYIYVMGIHEDRENISENIESFVPSLEIWNWEGEQVYRAMFDKPIQNFTISEEHRKIYAYSVMNSDIIYEFDLPNKLDL
jgi:hypothetical protein